MPPSSLEGRHFDAVIIGAGMSGLAAGIRIALSGKKVIILERHNAAGGLNSFYSIKGRKYDVGLHAMTNYVRPGAKGTPLAKLFRQLRIPREAFDLSEQRQSRIAFPGCSLTFTNDFEHFRADVAQQFPAQADAFDCLVTRIRAFDEVNLSNAPASAKAVVSEHISDPLLVDMLFLPLMYYGSAQEHDMDWSQFVIMFKALFLEGFARPFDGVRVIIRALLDKYRSLGGERKMKCGVQRLDVNDRKVTRILLENGESITADQIISSAGLPETLRLCSDFQPSAPEKNQNIGQLSFVESITNFKQQPHNFGWKDTIIFFNDSDRFNYRQPQDLVDYSSGVICLPNNYEYPEGQQLEEGILRVTALANYEHWNALDPNAYAAHKEQAYKKLQSVALNILGGTATQATLQADTLATDLFTPCTVKRFTGHLNGAIYGAPEKIRSGQTHLDNLYICGTDQGFLGIVGALLSGVTIANLHVLQA